MEQTMATRRGSKKVVKATSHPSLTHTFAARLRQLRTDRKWTLDDVIELGAGGSQGRLSRLERAVISPTLRTVQELARVLEVDPIDLLIDPPANPRHRLVDASARARGAALAAATALLAPEHHHATMRQVRERLDALPAWGQAAAHAVIRACVPDARPDVAEILLDLTAPQLAVVAALIDTLERYAPTLEPSERDEKPAPRAMRIVG